MAIASGTKYLALFYIRAGVRWAQWTRSEVSEEGDAYEELALRKDWVAIRED